MHNKPFKGYKKSGLLHFVRLPSEYLVSIHINYISVSFKIFTVGFAHMLLICGIIP